MNGLFMIYFTSSFVLPSLSFPMEHPFFQTEGTPNGTINGLLEPGEYWWAPWISPAGPVVILISLSL